MLPKMLTRSLKRLAFLSMVVLLTVWAFALFKFVPAQLSSVNEDHSTNNVEDSHRKISQIIDLHQSTDYQSPIPSKIKVPSKLQENDLQNMDSKVAQDLIARIKIDCRDSTCSEFVTKPDKPHYDYCMKKTWRVRAKYREPRDSVCRFIDGTGRHPIALASFPGSGNTWVRGLIQEVTGLCTGAIYCDKMLRKTGFPGESIRSGIVLVVKTHHYDPRWTGVHYDKSSPFSYFKKVEHIPVYSSGIFLLRNPFDSLVSEYSRQLREEQSDSHVSVPKQEHFGSNSSWDAFVHEQASVWERTINGWIVNNHRHPLLVVKYENLKKNTALELKRMLDFLQVPYSTSRLGEVVGRGYSAYKRKHQEEFDHYTTDQRNVLRNVVERVSESLKNNDLLEVADVSSYQTAT